MSEPLLRGLMQLFAIIAKLDGVKPDERKVVEEFLKQQTSLEAARKYLAIFDQYTSRKSKVKIAFEDDDQLIGERASVRDSSKMMLICTKVNQELTQYQKLVVLLRLIELVAADDLITEQEKEFISTAVDVFNVPTSEYRALEQFVRTEDHTTLKLEHLLIIDPQHHTGVFRPRYFHAPNIEGIFSVLRIPSVEMYLVRYQGSSSYYLNGIPLQPRQISLFPTGSTIRGQKLKTIHYSDIVNKYLQENTQQPLSFEAQNVYYKFSDGKYGLYDINIAERSGNLVGLMGASGSGKSTLLELLNGNRKPTSGQVLLNGKNIHTELDELRGAIGYVPQDDLLIEQLTVYQNLYYAARLCYGNHSTEQTDKLVRNTLHDLGLTEVSHLKVGSPLDKMISGGQRKRLNIGLELIRESSVLFVDEPTSGLSSRDSENVMDLLKGLALEGKLVFVVIHQPSSDIFKMFDKLLILDKGGYPVYYGKPIDAITYFKIEANQINSDEAECPHCGNVNPEQIFDIIEARVVNEFGRFTNERKLTPIDWYHNYKERITPEPVATEREKINVSAKIANRVKQLAIYFRRDVLSKLSNTQYLGIILAEAPLLALVLAYVCRFYAGDKYVYITNDNVPVFIFMGIIVALFMGLTVSAEEIFKDRKILKRESFLNLSRFSYLVAKMGILILISAYQTLIFILIGNTMLEIHGMHFTYWLVLFSVSVFANVLGLNISSAFNSAITIYILIPIILIPQLILGGIVVPFEKINPKLKGVDKTPLMADVMVSRWAFEALMVAQFKDNPFNRQFYEYERLKADAQYKKTYLIPLLETKLANVNRNIDSQDPELRQQVEEDLTVLRNTLRKEDGVINAKAVTQDLTSATFTPQVASNMETVLGSLHTSYVRKYNQANIALDNIVIGLTSTPEGKAEYLANTKHYTNDALNAIVVNDQTGERIRERRGQLVQLIYPIYKAPPPPNHILDYQAHFYAPYRYLLTFRSGTLWANVIIIWVNTLVWFALLHFDVLGRIIRWGLFSRLTKSRQGGLRG